MKRPVLRVVLTVVLVLGLALSISGPLARSFHPERVGTTVAFTPGASADTISANGQDPEGISLYWTQTTDSCFENYSLAMSLIGASGPWLYFTVIRSVTTTSYVAMGLGPEMTYWWTVFDYECSSATPTQGNVIQETQPSGPTLAVTQPTETSAKLSWSNTGTYGGGLSFDYYSVLDWVNGTPSSRLALPNAESDTSYTVSDLLPSTTYGFEVDTEDQGLGTPFTGGVTNEVTVETPVLLSANASVDRTFADQVQTVNFTCVGHGGWTPYSYSWAFGDSATGTGSPVAHQYGAPGTYVATCTVTDFDGAIVTSTASVKIDANPSATLTFSSRAILEGQSFTVTAVPAGGSAPYRFSWLYYPPGCTPGTTDSFSCRPTSTGTFTVQVIVMDSRGITTVAVANITVDPSFVGLPVAEGYAVVGGGVGALAVGTAVATLLVLRRRKKARSATAASVPPSGGSRPPPPPEA